MKMRKKMMGDLEKDSKIRTGSAASRPDLPVNTALRKLSQLHGPELEISTRTNTTINRAAAAGLIYAFTFQSRYAAARVEQVERLAISADGQGRRDIIDAIAAGGQVPDEYLNGGAGRSYEFTNLREKVERADASEEEADK